jgi:hypothetical protein
VTDEGHHERLMRIVEVPEDADLHAGLVGEAYHIYAITYVARWRGLVPMSLRHLTQLIECTVHLGAKPHLNRVPPFGDHCVLAVVPLVVVPVDALRLFV